MTITCDGGTKFVVELGKVTISHPGQADTTIPLADLDEFVRLYFDAE